MASPPSSSPCLGQRLLPVVIDELARNNPERAWAYMPKSSDLSDGFRDISFAAFANAINRLSWFLESEIGHSDAFETFAYIGPPDMRYHIMAMVAAKTGYKMLASSHMNSLAGHLNLFDQTNCNVLVYAESVNVDDIICARPLRQVVIPEVEQLLNGDPAPQYPFRWSYEEAKSNPYLVLHTSGTTGLPKPIVISHAYPAVSDAQALLCNAAHGRPVLIANRFHNSPRTVRRYVAFQPFHVASLGIFMSTSIFGNVTYVFGPSDRPPSLNTAIEVFNNANLDIAAVPPSLLEEFGKSSEALKTLGKVEEIEWAGGVLSEAAGNAVSKVTRLIQLFGSTEIGGAVLHYTDPEDWRYLAFDFQYNGIDCF